ncbi:N-6 DNA methylase [Nostoc sp.]|uniref:N-6 DNA methylase n=1 Tax=Nostoc sp. TaxID=1180 RepID=UPI003FA60EBC
MANPPFAGDIKEPRMIARYDLAKKPDGKWQSKVGRDILFIERNLDFLKPGGRMAIVLPQGRFNNSSDKNIRDFIAERCRILSVVGLHGNTFKPHTGTKTSVLFVQKWNDDPKAGALCPRQNDYNIFFATMRKSGKDNSGDKIWRKISSSTASPPDDELSDLMPPSPVRRVIGVESDFLQDKHGHLVVDHDLYNHEGRTEDGIAEAFIEFAKKENLSFFEPSPSVTPFDAMRYQRLMDGLEAVELLFSEAKFNNASLRVDAEFFQKGYLSIVKALGSTTTQPLSQVARKIDVGHVGSMVSEYDESGILLLQTRNIDEFFVNTEECQRITQKFHKQLKKSQIKKGDVLIARSGSFGKASIYLDSEVVNSADIIIVESNKNHVNPFYLVGFLNSKLGTSQLFRFASGGLQGHVNLTILENLLVPTLKFNFQDFLELLIKYSYKILKNSKKLYQQAEDLLLSELGLKDWQPTEETVAVKSFAESFLSSGRFDAEYYQPKFDQLIKRLEEKVELTPLGDLLTLNQRGKQPQYIEDEDEYKLSLPVINSKHVREGEVMLTDNRYAYLSETNDPLTIQTDDVLINGTGIGTIGRCAPYFYEQKALPDNHVTILRTDSLDSVYLSIYLNSMIGKLLVEKHFKGSSGQIELYPNEIAQFLVWDAPESVQQKIRSKVEASHQKREQSKQLLEIAKTGVERAIEQDEEKATTWINQQLEAIGINLSN